MQTRNGRCSHQAASWALLAPMPQPGRVTPASAAVRSTCPEGVRPTAGHDRSAAPPTGRIGRGRVEPEAGLGPGLLEDEEPARSRGSRIRVTPGVVGQVEPDVGDVLGDRAAECRVPLGKDADDGSAPAAGSDRHPLAIYPLRPGRVDRRPRVTPEQLAANDEH